MQFMEVLLYLDVVLGCNILGGDVRGMWFLEKIQHLAAV